MKLKSAVLLSLLSLQVFANIDGFSKRFQIVRDDQGKLLEIKDRTLTPKFSLAPYLEFIKSSLKQEQKLMNSSTLADGEYENQVRDLFQEEMNLSDSEKEAYVEKMVQSLVAIKTLPLEEIFATPVLHEVVSKFELKMKDAQSKIGLVTVAMPNDPKFFYQRNVTWQVVVFGLDLAKNKIAKVPVLNTAVYVIKEVEKMMRIRREYHQNILMSYLQSVTPESVGLTHDEVNMIFSSIYESRIAWWNIFESQGAQINWYKYGMNSFFTQERSGDNFVMNSEKSFDAIGDRVNYAFRKATYKGQEVIINAFDKESSIENRPAIAMYLNNPNKVKRMRILMQLAQYGLSYVPVSGWIKSMVEDFLKSHYEHQEITEGALLATFEINKNLSALSTLKAQYINPFDY